MAGRAPLPLSATLTFSDHVLYPTYAHVPQLFAATALSDQATAGVIMWVPGSLAFMIPAVALAVRLLSPTSSLVRPGMTLVRGRASAVPRLKTQVTQVSAGNRFDLLTVPVLGNFLRSRLSRRTMQIAMLLLALGVILDGVRGPQSRSVNLAGVLPWTCWRGFVVVALLAAGKLTCEISVGLPARRLAGLAPYLALPLLLVALFAINQSLRTPYPTK